MRSRAIPVREDGWNLADRRPARYPRTKIVCTLGPVTDSRDVIRQMVIAGMSVARVNFAHGEHAAHARMVRLVRRVSSALGRKIALLGDLPGPKIRLGKFRLEPTTLYGGQLFQLTVKKVLGDSEMASVTEKSLPKHVRRGSTIFLADGTVRLRVIKNDGEILTCRVLDGGRVSSGKGVNVPDLAGDFPSVTKEDKTHLDFALRNDFDIVAVSFVRTARDIECVRGLVQGKRRNLMIMAKIEKRQAMSNLDSIIEVSDGVMVARGDLGVEMGLERVPILQDGIIRECNEKGKPVVTATQMLLSMIQSPTPTRAEVSDIADAVQDGTDAVMLSEETAIGRFPVEAVRVMARVAAIAEQTLSYADILASRRPSAQRKIGDAISLAACEIALKLGCSAIVASTRSGTTARRVSRYRPPLPIVALTADEKVANQLAISWGVIPYMIDRMKDHIELFEEAEKATVKMGLTGKGDRIVIVGGDLASPYGTTNLLKVHTVLERDKDLQDYALVKRSSIRRKATWTPRYST